MTAKEKLLERAPQWTEREAEIALQAVERESSGSQSIVDEWGDLSAQTQELAEQAAARLAQREREAGRPWQ